MLATDSAGNSPFSNVATATTQTPPAADRADQPHRHGGAGQINLSWTASTANVAITGYLVYRENPGSIDLRAGRHDQRRHHLQRHWADGQQHLQLRGARPPTAAGNSPFSNVATATTAATIPGLVAAYRSTRGRGPRSPTPPATATTARSPMPPGPPPASMAMPCRSTAPTRW